MVQFIRFLRRTEGVEAARKYFLDARKSQNCSYHVYIAYAMMTFCLDKDPKVPQFSRICRGQSFLIVDCQILLTLLFYIHKQKFFIF